MSTTTAASPSRDIKTLVLDVLSALARFYMAYVWISAGWSKIGVRLDTAKTIEAYEIFTPAWSDLLAQIIGPLELAGGLLLLLGINLRWSGKVSIYVLVLFIIGMLSAWQRGLVIDCGCFDPSAAGEGETNLLSTVFRDVIYIAITGFMMWRPFKKFAIYP